MAEDDWAGWARSPKELGDKGAAHRRRSLHHQPERIERASSGIANAVLIKLNQIGTVSETLRAIVPRIAPASRGRVASSGETEDATIADLAVATNCGQLKTGSLSRSDRLAKYNQLLRIAEQLGPEAVYAGRGALKR